MSRRLLCTLAASLGLALAGAGARADDGDGTGDGGGGLAVSGWARLDAFSSTRTLDDRRGDGSVEVGLKTTHDIDDSQRLKFEGALSKDLRDHRGRVRVVDGYWQHRGDTVDWRIGQQKVSWGKADGLNPTDFFTPRDFTVLQPFEEDQRRSVPALRADVAMGDGQTLSLVAHPHFIAERQPARRDVPISQDEPSGWRRPQLGLRYSSTAETLDWSVSAFRGYLNSPLYGFDPGRGLVRHFAELDALGADVARNFGRWGFRAEAAWLQPHSTPGLQDIRPQLYLVSGIDHGEDDWNINVQAVLRHTPGWRKDSAPDPFSAAAAQLNAINFGQLHRRQLGLTSRLSANWLNQTLQGEVLVVHYFNPGNTLVRPLLTYALDDRNKVTAGAEYYRGPDASFFGQLKDNRTVFVEYRHFF